MSKKRDRSELEALRGKNRKLQSVIKDLTKKAGRSKKIENRIEGLEQDLLEQLETGEYFNVPSANKCKKCNEGFMEIIDLKVKQLSICSVCKYRQVIK